MKLFLDIETVPKYENPEVDQTFIGLFKNKFKKEIETQHWEEVYSQKAGLFAEFGKVVCVSLGSVVGDQIFLESFFGQDENEILRRTCNRISKADSLVAHNGKEFDFPWLCRRMIINRITLPTLLQIQNLKPWEIRLEDTVDMWRFGQFNYRSSLATMCYLLGLPSPKAGMDGSQVAEVFYKEKDYKKIAAYCEGDVIALINVYRKMQYQEPLTLNVMEPSNQGNKP